MSLAIVCGVLWIAGALTSLLAYLNIAEISEGTGKFKKLAKVKTLISACLYSVGYVIFAGLFGAIMAQIEAQNSELDNNAFLCEKVKKKFRRSGNEFMSYSICGFLLITPSIIFTFCSAFLLKSPPSSQNASSDRV